MSDEERNKKLDELLEIIKKAPAMNGGFVKLSDMVNQIQECNAKMLYELQVVKNSLESHTKKLNELQQALYEPDQGLYRRVRKALEENEQQTEDLESIGKETKILTQKVEAIEVKNNILDSVVGKDLKELRFAISGRKHMSKAIWAVALAAIGGFIKFIWDIVPKIF